MLELLTLLFLFEAKQPALADWSPGTSPMAFAAPADPADGFTVAFMVDLKTFDGDTEIVEVPNVLSVRLRRHNPADRNRQNYPALKMPDGSVPVLEATLTLRSAEHADWKNMYVNEFERIRVPGPAVRPSVGSV